MTSGLTTKEANTQSLDATQLLDPWTEHEGQAEHSFDAKNTEECSVVAAWDN